MLSRRAGLSATAELSCYNKDWIGLEIGLNYISARHNNQFSI